MLEAREPPGHVGAHPSETEAGGEVGEPHHVPPHPPPLPTTRQEGQQIHPELVRPRDGAELLPPSVDHLSHVETEYEPDGDPVVEVSEVDADLLKALLHPLVLAEHQPVGEADAEVAEPEEEEVAPYALVDAPLPEEEKSEEGPDLARRVDVMHVGDRHVSPPLV